MSKESLVSQFFVAGLIYGDHADAKPKRGQRISLVKQPDNAYDLRAIQVYTIGKRVFLGWVPRHQTHQIHDFKGKITRAVIHGYEPANATHRRLLVSVYGIAATEQETNLIC